MLNAIRALADHRAALPSAAPSALTQTARLSATTALPAIPPLTADDATLDEGTPVVGNGTNYLLTNLILFTTHEPCIMCSMALLHSRVKEVVYLMPIPATGGCGGAACVPRLEGVNHRFGIVQWGNEEWRVWAEGVGVETDENLDA